jgi:type II secretory pathway predicted ATPase ExeA
MIETLQSHYGFTVMPFTAAIPVTSLFGSAAHKEAVARLRWLISARGLGVITGEVGCGKTAAVRAATSGLDPSRHTLIYLPNPQIGVRGIHGAVAVALGQTPRFHHATLIPQVEAALAAEADERNRHVILAIDITPAHRRPAGGGPDADQPRPRFRIAADHLAHRPAHPAAPPAHR